MGQKGWSGVARTPNGLLACIFCAEGLSKSKKDDE